MSDMSQDTTLAAPPAANPAIANATQALAIKELGETVAGVKKQVRTLWICFAVLAVVTVIVAVLTFVPSLRFGATGRAGFTRGQFGTSGTFQGAPGGSTNGGTNGGGTNGGTQGTVPGQ